MREIRGHVTDIDHHLEEALRAKQQLDAERWRRTELRPRVPRLCAARARTLTWSRALLRLVVAELFPDDLFTELVGNLDRVPRRHWPHVIAIAVARRHSWRHDGLSPISKRLRISTSTDPSNERHDRTPDHHDTDSRARLRPVKALRFASTPRRGAGGLDWALGRATDGLLRDGRGVLRTVREGRTPPTGYVRNSLSRNSSGVGRLVELRLANGNPS
jgi:hypothetical protein